MTSSTVDLVAPGDSASEETWRRAVEKALKGAAFDRLRSQTDDGIAIDPLYRRADGAYAQAGRKAGDRWRVIQRVDHPDAAAANGIALIDLENGADGLEIVVAGAANAYGYGLDDPDADPFRRLFADIYLDGIRLLVSPGPFGRRVASALAEAVLDLGFEAASTDIDFGLDPIGALAAGGDLSDPWEVVGRTLAETVATLKRQGFSGPFLCADGRPYHNAGASEAQELAAILATAVSYLRALEDAGMAPDDAVAAIGFAVSVDADQFLGIAKCRALRRLWARVAEACGVADADTVLHAETAWRMMTRRDPWVNMLRTTIATFAAGVGGVDSLAVLPCSAALGLADPFARRIARNTQAMLLEESNLHRVADPGSGSGFVEAMTDALTRTTWALFQEIEGRGGIVAALQDGFLRRRLDETNAARSLDVDRRKRPITGTSAFPDIFEKPISLLPVAPVAAPARRAGAAVRIAPLLAMRLAEPYERLREAADAHAAETGRRPAVFLANLGRIADFTARATWAKNAFEAGGIEALTNDGFKTADDAAAAFAESGAAIACICSSDDLYRDNAAATARALKAAGAGRVYLAGRGGEAEDALRAAGVDGFLFAGCAIVDMLAEVQAALGVGGTPQTGKDG